MDHVEPEAELRALMTLQADGIRTHAIDQIMAPYHSDAVMFDIKPPFQINGADAIREMWNQCLPYMSKAATHQEHDMQLVVDREWAYAHWLIQIRNMMPQQPDAEMWLRVTACYRRMEGRWQVVHEHCSVPFDPRNGMAVMSPNAPIEEWKPC